MRILISGGTGLAGSYLVPFLTNEGHSITILTTRKTGNSLRGKVEYSHWNPATGLIDPDLFSRHDVVINMAGANLGERWTANHKKAILESRVNATELLATGAVSENSVVKSFISFSATGIYTSDDRLKSEDGATADSNDFPAYVCQHWEAAASLVDGKMQKVILRLGILLSPRGGMLGKLLPLFRMGLGASIGSGRQYISWIHPDDLCRILTFILERPSLSGVINATAPNPVTMRQFAVLLAKQLKRPLWLPSVVGWQLRLIGGEGALEALKSFRIKSDVLESENFVFEYENIREAFRQLFGNIGQS